MQNATNRIPLWVYEEALQEMYYVGKGRFKWLKSKGGGRSKDSLVGKDEPCGYRIIGYTATDGRRYHLKNSYLVWIYEKGTYPSGVIDHINRIKSDDSPINLRDVSYSDNSWNSGPRGGTNKGIHFLKTIGKYRAGYRHKGRYHTIGYYENETDAVTAYNNHVSERFPTAYLNK